jgi:endonuclease-3
MKESREKVKSRARKIVGILRKTHPDAETALLHENPLQLLVATILSAQCTDQRVNMVTPGLFRRYPGVRDFASSGLPELERYIRSTGFYRAKARSIKGACEAIVSRHGGIVPDVMDDLVELPGVGRKTANVVLGSAFGKACGVVVDTHVKRLSGRLGLSGEKTPEKIEADLMELLPRKDWIAVPHLLIWHGRKICKARTPLCAECSLNRYCPTSEA